MRAFGRLAAPHGVVVNVRERLVEKRLVIAAAMDIAVGCRVRELIRANQVAATDVNGIQRELLGDTIHDALPDETHPRFADAAVGHDRTLVGDDGPSIQS